METDDAGLAQRLRGHVEALAGAIGERNVFRVRRLEQAGEYISGVWASQGYRVERQVYTVRGVDSANLEVCRTGRTAPGPILLVGAHYDSIRGSPGANDNASGVAVLLELSRLFTEAMPALTVRFVAFVNEEPPFFFHEEQGSMEYARAARRRGDDIRLMVSLETLGYYDDAPGSQRYPPLLRWFYPSRGDFVAFVSDLRSRGMLRRMVRAFRSVTDFPAESASLPAVIPGVAWSDHYSFWRHGYRALMVTDTALYRYPWYHAPGDTPEKLDYTRLARVTKGLFDACLRMAAEPADPL
ncbi:MAG TPA: M28 family peptidase [Gammaproteobacteria bacterium]|nr:M28 family peptidase [Gammaproteobacteria bacterium]